MKALSGGLAIDFIFELTEKRIVIIHT